MLIDLEKEYREAEREYDLAAFDTDPGMAYELTLYQDGNLGAGMEEEVLCVRSTMREIKEEIGLLDEQAFPATGGILVIAFELDDSRPTPAYLLIHKELNNIE